MGKNREKIENVIAIRMTRGVFAFLAEVAERSSDKSSCTTRLWVEARK
jgi:hypothetical protein